MEDTLKQILSELKEFKNEVNERFDKVEKQAKENFDHVTKEIFKSSVKSEDAIKTTRQDLDSKLDRIYNSTVGIAKQFTDSNQELPSIRYRQAEHSNQLEDHEERIMKLEAVE